MLLWAQPERNKFKQLHEELPTPNVYRTASGAPGHLYWQQQADYKMKIALNDDKQSIHGEQTITYHNNSPDQLSYLWIQLDQNMRAKDSDTYKIRENKIREKMTLRDIKSITPTFEGGFNIDYVRNTAGKNMNYTIVKTMMRLDLPEPLKNGESISFDIKWWYNINNRMEIGGRSGFEYFEEEDNYLYTIAQFFPRMAVYSDDEGWQNKQFLGRGEFTLPFGNYEVDITVPSDHYVSATGVLQNESDVLSQKEIERFREAEKARDEPVIIVTEKEAKNNEKSKASGTKTWKFKAENVRDFGFASSRKFIWDAMGVEMSDGRVVMAMSMYPKEGNPLWERYSTKAVAHTLKWYSHYTIDYPYPVAWSIHADRIGMEYPMICFNFGRPEKDGTYSARTKYGMIGVIIHEVGHNFFPMIINSDERQWTWMDEGLNSFVQHLAQVQWERDFPSRRGPAHKIVNYMKGDKSNISPIMTNSESIFQFGNNAYGKPATALNILRESIIGRELFDFAFKNYSERWAFKHPSPADFFRSMEDASGVDLDWFWWGWFYTTDHCDISIDNVQAYNFNTKNPDIENALSKREAESKRKDIGHYRDKEEIAQTYDEKDRKLRDFYTDRNIFEVNNLDRQEYNRYLSKLSDEEKAILNSNDNFYEVTFENKGGLVMPIILELEYTDGSKEMKKIPAEIWRYNQQKVTKVFASSKELKQVNLDPFLETADVDTSNNTFPPTQQISKFELFKQNRTRENPMQRAERAKKAKSSGTNK